jgi:PKD domain
MSILQEPPAPPLPVVCDFFFEQTGPPGTATYDGDIYPYPPLPSDKGSDARYAWGTTPVFLAVEFFATRQREEREEKEAREKWVKEEEASTITKKEREEKETNQTTKRKLAERTQGRVTAPPGITILEYFWDFGDGFTGHGPIVTHTYEVPDPTTSISLTVLDSLGREFSTSKALSLLVVDFGYVYTRIRGQNTETPPKRQEREASGDFALTVEVSPSRVWIARGGKPVREETEQSLSSDRASVTTHFFRHTSETVLSSDAPVRTRGLFRSTTDPNRSLVRVPSPPVEVVGEGQSRQRLLATIGPAMPYPEPSPFYEVDKATRTTHRFARVTDTAVSSDARPTWRYRRLIEAVLGLLGKSPH